jgi:hypothetical protein
MGRAFPASYVPLPPDQLDPHFVPPEIRTALLDPSLQVQAGFARLSHGRDDDNVDGLMLDVRGPFAHDPEELIALGSATAEPPHTVRSKRNSRVWLMSSASSRSPARRKP